MSRSCKKLVRQGGVVVGVATVFLTIRIFIINDDTLAQLRGNAATRPMDNPIQPRDQVAHAQNFDQSPERPAPPIQVQDVSEKKPPLAVRKDLSNYGSCDKKILGKPDSVSSRDKHGAYDDVTCSALLSGAAGDPVYKRAKAFMKEYPYAKPLDSDTLAQTSDCQAFKESRGYHVTPVSENEADFPIAYNILMHKDAAQVEFLLRAIYRPQNVYCIHIDANQGAGIHNAMRSLAQCFDNVYIASKLEHIVYAGFTRLQADINCMQDQVKKPIEWKYLINLAGQAFPLKTNEEIVNILRIYNGANDIEGIYGRRILKSRFDKEWIEKNKTLAKTGRDNPAPPFDIEIVRGSAYGIFSRKFVEFIVTDEKAKALLEWSRKTYSPDEHYWATLHHTYGNPHLKTPGRFSGRPDQKKWMAVWVAWGGVDKCHGMWKRGTCVFGVEDLPQLLPHFELFANKFYIEYEHLTLECLDRWIEYKSTCPAENVDYEFYEKLKFIYKS